METTILNFPYRLALACTLSLAVTGVAFAQTPPKQDAATALSVEGFFKPHAIQDVDLSPSGRWMSIRELNGEGRVQLKVIDLEGKEPPRIVAKFSRLDVDSVTWVNDEWMVFSTFDEVSRDGKSQGSGLASVNRDGTRLRELIKKKFDTAFPGGGAQPLEPNHRWIGLGAPGTNDIVVAEAHYDANWSEVTHTTPRILDVSTGAVRSMFKGGMPTPPANVLGWVIDRKGQARVGYGKEGGRTLVYWSDPATKQWRKIADYETLNADFVPEYVDEKDQLFVSVVNAQTRLSEIRKFNFATGKPEAAALLGVPGFDVEDVTPIRDPGDNTVHGLRLLTDAQSVAWFNPAMQKIQQKVDALLPGRVNVLQCRPCSVPKTVLIYSYSDTTPGDYLMYKSADDKFERIAEVRPGHRADLMANKELYRTKTRDGKDLPVWITKQEGKVAGPRPAVVVVHGGPSGRGEWRYDAEAQFLATRGYVVVEPEFRGSTGYGTDHYRSGWRQWGQLMQDDVADALKFAVDKGWVDPKKVCIAGASYGGYSTLMGLAKHGDLYKCGVAWLAVTDPRLLYSVHWSDMDDDTKQFNLPQTVGDLQKDAAMLKANAPVELAAKIKAPLILAYGAKDRRVPIVHGEKMRAALAASGAKPEWIVYDDEGHGWSRTSNQIDFWHKVETFLAKNLK